MTYANLVIRRVAANLYTVTRSDNGRELGTVLRMGPHYWYATSNATAAVTGPYKTRLRAAWELRG